MNAASSSAAVMHEVAHNGLALHALLMYVCVYDMNDECVLSTSSAHVHGCKDACVVHACACAHVRVCIGS